MIEFLKKKWIEWVVGVCICILTVILTNHFAVKNESRSALEKKIEGKADLPYVIQQDEATRKYVDTQINNTKDVIKQHSEESERAQQAQLELMKSIDRKVNILINNR